MKRNLITTTALTLVVGTTVFFGSAMPLVQKYLVPPKFAEKHEYDELVEVEDVDGDADHGGPVEAKKKKINSSHKELVHSEHE